VFFTSGLGRDPGQIVFCLLSRISSDEPSRLTTSSIGCAIPKGINKHGYISEHHAFGQRKAASGIYAEQLARSMYHTWTNEEPMKNRPYGEVGRC
ncbi:MAG: hypothetical protein MIO92_11285, partial [Methanosarcinaceae archaeon]|nr:hypothetical protein [Methanosarcinaceae archaeon]